MVECSGGDRDRLCAARDGAERADAGVIDKSAKSHAKKTQILKRMFFFFTRGGHKRSAHLRTELEVACPLARVRHTFVV